jgi:hypothetical protein
MSYLHNLAQRMLRPPPRLAPLIAPRFAPVGDGDVGGEKMAPRGEYSAPPGSDAVFRSHTDEDSAHRLRDSGAPFAVPGASDLASAQGPVLAAQRHLPANVPPSAQSPVAERRSEANGTPNAPVPLAEHRTQVEAHSPVPVPDAVSVAPRPSRLPFRAEDTSDAAARTFLGDEDRRAADARRLQAALPDGRGWVAPRSPDQQGAGGANPAEGEASASAVRKEAPALIGRSEAAARPSAADAWTETSLVQQSQRVGPAEGIREAPLAPLPTAAAMARSAQAAPSVHIQIGRIEVRASTPPPPRPPRALPQPALSLKDYLARQKGSGR